MNSLYTFCGAVLCFACLAAVIKQLRPEFFPVFAAGCGVASALYILSLLLPAAEFLKGLSEGGAFSGFFKILYKSVGVALLCGATADVCRDCGEATLAARVETAGKAVIILLSLPVVEFLLSAAQTMAG